MTPATPLECAIIAHLFGLAGSRVLHAILAFHAADREESSMNPRIPRRPHVLLAAIAAPIMAHDAVGETTNVRTDGVDFNNPSDVKAFYGRLEIAAHKVCDLAGNSLEVREDNADCRARAIDGAVADLKKSRLSELHAERSRHDPQLADARQRTW